VKVDYTTYETRFRAQHDCPYLDFSKSFEHGSLFGYCSREFDVMMVPGELKVENVKLGKKLFKNFDQWKINTTGTDSKTTYIILDCDCDSFYFGDQNSITSRILKSGGMMKYPIIYEDGWEYHRVLCLNEKVVSNVLKLIQTLPTWEILANEDMGIDGLFKSQMLSIQEIIGDLTLHQADILAKAYEGGYYDIPRRIRIQDIADELKISRYGVEKVLRAGENKLIRSIMPYLYFKTESN
jgi:predicted DNA binding protein